MKTRKGSGRQRGFTLIELLIVIIIIGILAGMLMLVSSSATDKASATRISGEIRSMKAAALLYYNDEDKWPNWTDTAGNPEKYLERRPIFDNYWLGVIEDTSSGDMVAVIVAGESLDQGVKDHLTKMATDMGYYGSTGISSLPPSATRSYYAGDNYLICFIDPD